MDAVLGDINVEDPTRTASKDEEIKAPGVTAAATEAALREKKGKKDKKRKSDALVEAVAASGEDAMDVGAPEGGEKKCSKKDRKSTGGNEDDADKKEKKKSKKEKSSRKST